MEGSSDRLKGYLSKHWLKIGIAAILVFIILKKDLSFQINLRSPTKTEQPAGQPTQPVREEKPREQLTDHLASPQTPASLETPPPVDHFEFPSIGGETPSRAPAGGELPRLNESDLQAFLQRFTHVAQAEQRKYGIPASIILANGLLFSHAGRRDLAIRGNNFFALPCTADWRGATGTYQGDCHRHYENAWTSFRDHSLYLTTGRLVHLRKLPANDYRAWAKSLEKEGFGNTKGLAAQLIQLIESHRLYELDAP